MSSQENHMYAPGGETIKHLYAPGGDVVKCMYAREVVRAQLKRTGILSSGSPHVELDLFAFARDVYPPGPALIIAGYVSEPQALSGPDAQRAIARKVTQFPLPVATIVAQFAACVPVDVRGHLVMGRDGSRRPEVCPACVKPRRPRMYASIEDAAAHIHNWGGKNGKPSRNSRFVDFDTAGKIVVRRNGRVYADGALVDNVVFMEHSKLLNWAGVLTWGQFEGAIHMVEATCPNFRMRFPKTWLVVAFYPLLREAGVIIED